MFNEFVTLNYTGDHSTTCVYVRLGLVHPDLRENCCCDDVSCRLSFPVSTRDHRVTGASEGLIREN